MVDLKKIRTEKGISQKQLADDCGIVRQTISNIECGISKPSIETAKKIAEYLEFDWVEFFAEEGDDK